MNVVVAGDQGPVVDHDPEIAANRDPDRTIAVAAQRHKNDGVVQGHVIGVGQGQGHEIEANTGRGHVRGNVGSGKRDTVVEVRTRKNELWRNFLLIQLLAR